LKASKESFSKRAQPSSRLSASFAPNLQQVDTVSLSKVLS